MVIQVHFSIDSTSLSYDVEAHVDGLFIAKIKPPRGSLLSYHTPAKIHLYRTPEGWKGDHDRSDIVKAIGQEIDAVIKQKEH